MQSGFLNGALSALRILVGCYTLFVVTGACSSNGKANEAQRLPFVSKDSAFILREVYSGKYCFKTRFYWRDSLRNMRDICTVWGQFHDSVNQVQIDDHGWQGRDCDTNHFLIIRQAGKAWFVPFCDVMTLRQQSGYRGWRDTLFFRSALAVTGPLNAALNGLALKDRQHFLKGFLDWYMRGHIERKVISLRVDSTNYLTLLDPKTRAYLRPRLGTPGRYYYRVSDHYNENALWEFDDTHTDGLHVRIIRPAWYECFSM